MEQLNRDCFCIGVNPSALHGELESLLAAHGVPAALATSHPHLFSALPVYVARAHVERVDAVVAAVEQVVALPAYRSAALAWAPGIAGHDPGSPGGLLGFDFHLGPERPRLIEINTNPGGALLNVLLAQAQRICMPAITAPPTDPRAAEDAVLSSLLAEWEGQRGAAPLRFVAIVDEVPEQQYLYPEFVMYRALLRQHGLRAEICAPDELVPRDGRLWWRDEAVDLVYNRLTDFALQAPAHGVLREAYLAGQVALTPHPRAHALYADKRDLSLLGDGAFLAAAGADADAIATLAASVPRTRRVTPDHRDAMWAERRGLFFKPAAGFGSKASYRGDKLTRRVWDEIAQGEYVAQALVAPSERRLASGGGALKVDLRCYAYRGQALLYAARVYQGQTTNFRTPGGGFAPVLTHAMTADAPRS
ncbi:hypothetical protein [Cognatilysobacter tabacisoli]|uniref:hypothetical protein n=1 Tax=Cognatilysobacter tabacisoli TaxID=2315424 RepID=UPI001E569283|nr:hypothetical protein [Lysobacter tabacisoli]